jgi:hypothetical protein
MTQTALKTRGDEVQQVMKLFKRRFDDRELGLYVPTLYRQVSLSDDPRYACRRGEILHQLGLYHWRRGDVVFARKLFELSGRAFHEFEYLGLARNERDTGMMLVRSGEPKDGLRRIHDALELHDSDSQNQKGRRQRRVTEGYLLRARVLSGERVDESLNRLVELALEGSQDFCLRDQHFVVDFARQFVGGSTRRSLDIRMLDISAERGTIPGTVMSIANVVIDTQMIVAGKILGKMFGKE